MKNMSKKIAKLRKLGMEPEEAMLFVRDIALEWFIEGGEGITSRVVSTTFGSAMQKTMGDPFDTRFSRSLNIDKKK